MQGEGGRRPLTDSHMWMRQPGGVGWGVGPPIRAGGGEAAQHLLSVRCPHLVRDFLRVAVEQMPTPDTVLPQNQERAVKMAVSP